MARHCEILTMLFGIPWNTSSDAAFAASILPILLRGLVATVQASVVGFAIALALGLAAGFLEPLESTSIHLIQTSIIRLLALYPRTTIDPAVIQRFNEDTVAEHEHIRDFIVAHYTLNTGLDTPFWREVRAAPIPDSLAQRLDAFRETGNILYHPTDLFGASNWFAILLGQGLWPHDYHPIADTLSREQLDERMALLARRVEEGLSDLPPHATFVARHCAARD